MPRYARRGDIIKLTKLRAKMINAPHGAASPEFPAFFEVTHPSARGSGTLLAKVLFVANTTTKAYGVLGREWVIGTNKVIREAWGDGEYEIVSESDIPDWVWAERAKRALLDD
jgi:hypothetical protein